MDLYNLARAAPLLSTSRFFFHSRFSTFALPFPFGSDCYPGSEFIIARVLQTPLANFNEIDNSLIPDCSNCAVKLEQAVIVCWNIL